MTKPPQVDRDALITIITTCGSQADHALVYYRDSEADLLHASLAHGARPDTVVRPRLRRTLLQEAALEGPEELFGAILAKAELLDHLDSDGQSALHHALRSGSGKKAKALIDAGARANLRNIAGLAPINMLQWVEDDEERTELAKTFVASGVGLDVRAEFRGTAPLHEMAQLGDLQSAKVLIEGGAICRIRDGKKRRPSELARDAGHADMASILEAEEERERVHGKIRRQNPDRAATLKTAAQRRASAKSGPPAVERTKQPVPEL